MKYHGDFTDKQKNSQYIELARHLQQIKKLTQKCYDLSKIEERFGLK